MNNIIQWIQGNPQQVSAMVALMTLCISFLSILLTIWSLHLSRQHNRKSVKPIPFVLQSDFENRIAVIVQNNGTGPLILMKAQAISSIDGRSGHLIDLLPLQPDGVLFRNFNKVRQVRSIRPGQQVDLIDLPVSLDDPVVVQYRDNLRQALGNITIELTYTDVYDTHFPVYAVALTWFHRHVEYSKKEL